MVDVPTLAVVPGKRYFKSPEVGFDVRVAGPKLYQQCGSIPMGFVVPFKAGAVFLRKGEGWLTGVFRVGFRCSKPVLPGP